jgi:hypothetical protein
MITFYCLRFETPPNLEGQVPVFITPGTGWPDYTPRHWVRFRCLLRHTASTWGSLHLSIQHYSHDSDRVPNGVHHTRTYVQKNSGCILGRRNVRTSVATLQTNESAALSLHTSHVLSSPYTTDRSSSLLSPVPPSKLGHDRALPYLSRFITHCQRGEKVVQVGVVRVA